MVKIKIKQAAGSVKQFGSMPLTFGLQKALMRYNVQSFQVFDNAKDLDGDEFNVDDDVAMKQCNDLVANVDKLYDEKTSLILRAFGNQFSVDDLDNSDAEEVDRVIAQLQAEASGPAAKNG